MQQGENMKTWITHGFDKIVADMPAPEVLKKEFSLSLTNGGEGGCQIVANSETDGKIQLKVKSCDGASVKLYSEHLTHEIKDHQYTDCIVPYDGEILDLKAGLSLPFYLDFKVENAGDHTAVFELCDGEGNKVESFTVKLHVWSFELPENKTFATAVWTAERYITKFDFGMASDICDNYKEYYDLLLEHGLSSYNLPYDVLDPRADEYMSDPRVTSFAIGIWSLDNLSDEEIVAYYNKLKSNPVWLNKAMVYPLDEPREPHHLVKYREACERFIRLCPGMSRVSPFYTNIQVGEGRDQVDEMAPTTNHWCPKLCLWDDSQSYDAFLNYKPEKSFGTRMDEYKAKGDKMWCYVCNDPITPYAQLFIDTPGNMQKAMFWQMYQRDIDGFLYWGTNYWGYWAGDVDPWENVCNGVGDGQGNPVYGEGFLLYPGTKIGKPGPLATTRLKTIRDAVNDIELFNLAGEHLGREWVKERINKATPTLTEYCSNDEIAAVRAEIGNALEAAMENK